MKKTRKGRPTKHEEWLWSKCAKWHWQIAIFLQACISSLIIGLITGLASLSENAMQNTDGNYLTGACALSFLTGLVFWDARQYAKKQAAYWDKIRMKHYRSKNKDY